RPVYAHEIMQRPSAEGLADLLADITALAPMARPAPRKNPRVAFILSSPRAGSTLLRVMLAGHPALFCPPELHLLEFDTLRDREQALGASYLGEGLQRAVMELERLDAAASRRRIQDWLDEDLSTQAVYERLQTLA